VVCAKEELRASTAEQVGPRMVALNSCLVEGDANQRAMERVLRRRSLVVSVVTQLAILAAILLVPIFSKTGQIVLAKVTPLPPYRPARAPIVEILHPFPRVAPTNTLQFCPACQVVPHPVVRDDAGGEIRDVIGSIEGPGLSDGRVGICAACEGMPIGNSAQPIPPPDTRPRVLHVTRIDPAQLLHRVEPTYPVLARQTRREGTVELRALIAEDGSVQSLEVLSGDAVFIQSAYDAVRQWRYKPTILNGRPVEVDTHITVNYRLGQ
jgi:periplasmic protein TonB